MNNTFTLPPISKERIDEERFRTYKPTSLIGLLATPIINLAWLPLDWFMANGSFQLFLEIRLGLLVFCLGLYFAVRSGKLDMELGTHISLAAFLFQVLFMMNVVPESALLVYNLGAAAYYLGLGSVLSWRPINSLIFLGYAALIAVFCFALFGMHNFTSHFRNGSMVVFTAWLIPAITARMRYNTFLTEITQRYHLDFANGILAKKNEEITNQRGIIEAAYNRITDSLIYAKKIQESILSSAEDFHQLVPNSFIINKPKDIVSGDFFWFRKKAGFIYIAVADCTGHGVPGALMTVLGTSILNQLLEENHLPAPKEILEQLNSKIRQSHTDNSLQIHEGMDIALVRIDTESNKLIFAGAKRPLFLINKGELKEIKGSKTSIGSCERLFDCFEEHHLEIEEDDFIYLFTDGLIDQMGGPKSRKYMIKRLREEFLIINNVQAPNQEKYLEKSLAEWQGEESQTDDILLLGFQMGKKEPAVFDKVLSFPQNRNE